MRDVIDDAKSNFVDEEVQIEHPMKVQYNHCLYVINYYIKRYSAIFLKIVMRRNINF